MKTLYCCFREVLSDCFKRTNRIELVFGIRAYNGQKMLEKYCIAVSFEKELFSTNNSIPISLNVQIMILILYNIDSPRSFVG